MKPHDQDVDRRAFLKTTTAAGLGIVAGGAGPGSGPLARTRDSRAPNEKVVVAIVGVNGRGGVLAQNFASVEHSEVAYVCDVDSKVVSKGVDAVAKGQKASPKVIADFRRILDDKSVDALAMATPDHWHAPMTLLALHAGKHVYLEKPSGHDPREDELLMQAAAKYDRLHVQLGTQARSGPHFMEALRAVKEGVIGKPYLARAWYANTRQSIGKGKTAPAPSNLDYELWQGPAPRTPYRDNVVHYNWHWFTRWGTGEICNNGTHEIDVARWFLGVDYPASVYSFGKRFHFDDDYEFPDTQEAVFEFENGTEIVWQGQSCNGLQTFDRSRGTAVLGTGGSLVIDRDGFVLYDLQGKVVRESKAPSGGDALNTIADDPLTTLHVKNFVGAVRGAEKLNAPIMEGAKTGMLCHLGTIAHQTGRRLRTDPKTGRILGDEDAMKRWGRSYAPGWEPKV